jgi:hypothetical protein
MHLMQRPYSKVGFLVLVLLWLNFSSVACQESISEQTTGKFEYHQVTSTAIDTIGYATTQHILYVRFTSGYEYHYFEVPRTVFENFLRAPSKGRFFNRHVKGQYRYQRL